MSLALGRRHQQRDHPRRSSTAARRPRRSVVGSQLAAVSGARHRLTPSDDGALPCLHADRAGHSYAAATAFATTGDWPYVLCRGLATRAGTVVWWIQAMRGSSTARPTATGRPLCAALAAPSTSPMPGTTGRNREALPVWYRKGLACLGH